ncbi:adenine phosphoribosyltransferase [candidate division KSB1 bacterium]|nr:MAG: adenine phosphoribosyltransferase [candidate division KSB1 bacterium]
MELEQFIRNVPDFPKKGIGFKDITTLLKKGDAFKEAIDRIYENFKSSRVDSVAGIEARGFIIGAALAYKWGIGFIPIRKPGKLPAKTVKEEYSLEYGTDAVEMHIDAIKKGEKVLLVDDLLATGGTIKASCNLIEKCGGIVAGIAFLVELNFLNGRKKINKYDVFSLIKFKNE